MPFDETYLKTLRERASKSRIYRKYQLTGLSLAKLLNDREHKALYMKLAKQHDADKLLVLARRIADKKDIKNKGAYFMSVFFSDDSPDRNHKQKRGRAISPDKNGAV